MREESTADVAEDSCVGYNLDGSWGAAATRAYFSATGGTYAAARVDAGATCDRVDPSWTTTGCSGCQYHATTGDDGFMTLDFPIDPAEGTAVTVRTCSIGEAAPGTSYTLYLVDEIAETRNEIFGFDDFSLDFSNVVAGAVEMFTIGGTGACVLRAGAEPWSQSEISLDRMNTYDGRCMYDLPAGYFFSLTNDDKRATCKSQSASCSRDKF